MPQKPYDAVVFMGRFQPFHEGHAAILRHAATLADTLLVLIGSAHRPRSVKNPFTYEERRRMVAGAAPAAISLHVAPLIDVTHDDDAWAAVVRAAAAEHLPAGARIALTGYAKDDSSYYLKLFPEWPYEGAPPTLVDGRTLNATDIRTALYAGESPTLPKASAAEIQTLQAGPDWPWLLREAQARDADAARRKAAKAALGEPIARVSAVAVVFAEGKALLVKRAAPPGEGLWAFPAAFPEAGESLPAAALRAAGIPARITGAPRIYDHPDRSEWGREIAFAYPMTAEAASAEAVWISPAEVDRAEIFADHYDILSDLAAANNTSNPA